MDNVRKILKDRHLNVNGFLALIHDGHPDCGLPYHSLRRLVSHERKMTIDEAIFPHGQLKGMTAVDIYHAIEQDDRTKEGSNNH